MGTSAETNRKEMEIESNEKIANQNLDFQREKLKYDMDLQQQIFQREDTAYQRTVNDMRKAGVSPLMMQGTNSAGEAIATTAPYNDMHYDYMTGVSSDVDKLSAAINAMSAISNLSKTAAEARSIQLSNDYAERSLDSRVATDYAQMIVSRYNALSAREKQYYNNYYHITDSMPTEQKLANITATILSGGKKTGQSLKSFENGSTSFNDFTDYGTFDEMLSNLLGNSSNPVPNNPVSKFADSISNSEKKDIYGNSGSDADKKILEKVKNGEKLTLFESFIYFLMKNGVK